ncbi:MAG: hypothetical protein ACI8XV_001163, partial [Arenicella sp.]
HKGRHNQNPFNRAKPTIRRNQLSRDQAQKALKLARAENYANQDKDLNYLFEKKRKSIGGRA